MSQLPEYLSASSISTFQQCPLKYKLSRVDKVQEPPTRETIMGNFVHEVMESFYAPDTGRQRDIKTIKQISTEVWESGDWQNRVSGYLRDMTMHKFRWNAWWCIENIFKLEDPNAVDVKGIELELNVAVDGVKIKGFIDRLATIDGHDKISDYKTGKTPRDIYMEDKFFQLMLYYVCLSQSIQMSNPVLELLYLKDGQRKQITPTDDLCVQTTETVVSVNSRIVECNTKDEWPAVPAKLCDWCFFKYNGCTYYQKRK